MADRVHPSAKTNINPPPPPPLKPQMYPPQRRPYRPIPQPRQRRRSCCRRCCLCCIWLTIVILALILLAAIAGGVVYVLYHPRLPTFSVAYLKITTFNLTSDSLDCRLDIKVSVENRNSKIIYNYERISVHAHFRDADLSNGSIPGFSQGNKNTTTLKASLSSGGPRDLSPQTVNSLRSYLKKNSNKVPLDIRLKANAKARLGSLKTSEFEFRALCRDIVAGIPKQNASAATFTGTSKPSCKLQLMIWRIAL